MHTHHNDEIIAEIVDAREIRQCEYGERGGDAVSDTFDSDDFGDLNERL